MAKQTLMIGPVPADRPINPGDPDEIGNISGAQGVKYDALELIQKSSAAYQQLGPILALGRDEARTAALDIDEVEKVTGTEVAGASVRGTGDGPRVVVYLTHSESGRSTKGMVPYTDLPKSQAAYEDAQRLEADVALAARSAGGSNAGEDPRVATLQKEIERLRDEVNAAKDPEPFDGYADATADEILAHIDGESDPVEREILKRQIAAYESDHKARKTVLAAAEPVALVDPEDDSSDS